MRDKLFNKHNRYFKFTILVLVTVCFFCINCNSLASDNDRNSWVKLTQKDGQISELLMFLSTVMLSSEFDRKWYELIHSNPILTDIYTSYLKIEENRLNEFLDSQIKGGSYRLIDSTSTKKERELYKIVREVGQELGLTNEMLSRMKVYIDLESEFENAFVFGNPKKQTNLFFSKKLVDQIKREQIKSIIFHEMAHALLNHRVVFLIDQILSSFMVKVLSLGINQTKQEYYNIRGARILTQIFTRMEAALGKDKEGKYHQRIDWLFRENNQSLVKWIDESFIKLIDQPDDQIASLLNSVFKTQLLDFHFQKNSSTVDFFKAYFNLSGHDKKMNFQLVTVTESLLIDQFVKILFRHSQNNEFVADRVSACFNLPQNILGLFNDERAKSKLSSFLDEIRGNLLSRKGNNSHTDYFEFEDLDQLHPSDQARVDAINKSNPYLAKVLNDPFLKIVLLSKELRKLIESNTDRDKSNIYIETLASVENEIFFLLTMGLNESNYKTWISNQTNQERLFSYIEFIYRQETNDLMGSEVLSRYSKTQEDPVLARLIAFFEDLKGATNLVNFFAKPKKSLILEILNKLQKSKTDQGIVKVDELKVVKKFLKQDLNRNKVEISRSTLKNISCKRILEL